MAQNFTIAGKASVPLEDTTVTAPIDLGITFPFTGRADFSRRYDSAVTDDPVSLGTLATSGAKGVTVKCISGSCTIKFNGGTVAWPLSAGGGTFSWQNSAQGFLTAALITTTGAATVVFLAVG
jgi:hypothetical protein